MEPPIEIREFRFLPWASVSDLSRLAFCLVSFPPIVDEYFFYLFFLE